MSDQQVGLLALAAWVGALLPVGSSLWWTFPAAIVTLIAWRRRWPLLIVVGTLLLAATAAGAAWAKAETVPAEDYSGKVVLLSDPEPVSGGVRVTAEVDGDRYVLRAWGSPAGWLRYRLMGEVVDVDATLRPLGDAPTWLRAQGLAGRATVTAVHSFDVGAPHTRLANSLRRTIESGAASLSRDDRALFVGLVYGDDRTQSELTADNFDAAGLTHLLAVSGQNVAFVLAIAGPLLRRLEYRQRFVFVLVVLVLFATVTRFEASVVRASVMTAVAAVAALVGSEVSSSRVLSLAVALLIVLDPLIVHSIAFQLSVAASAGILLWSGRVARAVPGPRVLVEALAITATAQIAVAPLLVWQFDGLPVASLPANLLAGPAAGPVMMWGLTGGLVAGLVPAWLASVLHLPTRALVWWIDSVASVVPQAPLGRLGALHIAVLFVAAAVGLRLIRSRGRSCVAGVLLGVLLHPALVLAMASPRHHQIDGGSMLWRGDDVTILELDAGTRPDIVLSTLRSENVGDIDLVIAHQGSRGIAQLITWIQTQRTVTTVWAPERSLGVGEIIPPPQHTLVVDDLRLTVKHVDNELVVTPDIGDS